MPLIAKPIYEFNGIELAEAMTLAFDGYVMQMTISGLEFEQRFRAENADPEASRLYFGGDDQTDLAGILMVTRLGGTARIGAMGVTPDFRRQGVGSLMMREAIGASASRGDTRLILEVIEQNPSAVDLYEKLGFRTNRRLIGYRANIEPCSNPKLHQVDLIEAANFWRGWSPPDIPYELSPDVIGHRTAPTVAYRLGESVAIIQLNPNALVVWTLITDPDHRRQGQAKNLLKAVAAEQKLSAFHFPAVIPETWSVEFFVAIQAEALPISQFEMELRHLS